MKKATMLKGLLWGVFGGTVCSPILVVAQERGLQLEEVIVTAQKRNQSVQDVPLSIGLVDGDLIERIGIRSTADLDNFVPGLIIQETPQNLSTITIRGVGTASGNETYDQSVSMFVDGVYAGRQREFQAALFDVERIEVIKGTQNTLMGKNTSLGAISLITNKPGNEFGGFVEIGGELEYGSVSATGAIDIPGSVISTRLAFNRVDSKGYVENIFTGEDLPHKEQDTIRMTNTVKLSDGAEIIFSYTYDDLAILGDAFQATRDEPNIIRGQLDRLTEIRYDDKKTSFVVGGEKGETIDEQVSQRASLIANIELSEFTLSSITGWSEYENDRVIDSDFTAGEFLFTTYDTAFDQVSQELRLTSPQGGKFDFIAGLYYLNSDFSMANLIDASFPQLQGFPIIVDGSTTKTYAQETTAYSVFGQGTWYISDAFRISTGLRWTEEEKDASIVNVSNRLTVAAELFFPAFPEEDLFRSEESVDGSINLQLDVSVDSMLYASWAQGTKSGGFTDAARLPDEAEYEEEVAQTSELGIKTMLMDGLIRFNAAVFYIEIDDFQIVAFTGTAFETSTVPARSNGAEFDAFALVSEHLRIFGGLTYANALQTDTDDQLPQSARVTSTLGMQYENNLFSSNLLWSLDASLMYRDKMYHHMNEIIRSDSYNKVDARLAVYPAKDSWQLALLVRNLGNEEITSYGFEYPLLSSIPGNEGEKMTAHAQEPRRTFALMASYKF